jgi:transcriptional regulator with XRE-family HTH domain
MHPIEQARKQAHLTGAEVSRAVGRTALWLTEIENGKNSISPDTEQIILTAIRRLERFAQSVAEAKEKLTADLRLPPSLKAGTRRPRLTIDRNASANS